MDRASLTRILESYCNLRNKKDQFDEVEDNSSEEYLRNEKIMELVVTFLIEKMEE